MAKSFRKFREGQYDDEEWGSDDDYRQRKKEMKMENRRNKRKLKREERQETFSENIESKRK
jgi:hypothetical protein